MKFKSCSSFFNMFSNFERNLILIILLSHKITSSWIRPSLKMSTQLIIKIRNLKSYQPTNALANKDDCHF